MPPTGTSVRLSTRMAIGVLALLIGGLMVSPKLIRSAHLERILAREIGYPVHVGGSGLAFSPWPRLEFRDTVAYPLGPGALPISVRIRRLRLGGLPWPWQARSEANLKLELSGLELSYGPLHLREALLNLEQVSGTVRVQGRALGTLGGSVEIGGAFGRERPAAEPLRAYLAQLQLPMPDPLAIGSDRDEGRCQLTGIIRIEGDLTEQRIDFDIATSASRPLQRGEWLKGLIRGQLVRRNGQFQPGNPIHLHADLRALGSGRELRAVHGPADFWLELVGDADTGEAVLRADLEQLRLRFANLFEKPANIPAKIRYQVGWTSGGGRSDQAQLDLGGLRVRLDRQGSGAESRWHLRSDPLQLSELQQYLPVLRAHSIAAEGVLVADIRVSATRGLEARFDLEDVRLTVGSVALEIPSARIDLDADGTRFHVPTIVIAGQSLSLDGELEWIPSPGRMRVRIAIRADDLDLEPPAALIAPLVGAELPRGKKPRSGSWMGLAASAVQALRADGQLLSQLQLEAATLELGRVRGFGLDRSQVRLRAELSDRLVRLEHGEGRNRDSPKRYALDLGAWVPKLTVVH